MNETTAQTALVSWVRGAAGLPANRVFMAEQDGPNPEDTTDDPFATLRFASLLGTGASDEVAYINHEDDEDPPDVGQELELKVLAYGVLVVTLQLYSAKTYGTTCAMALAQKCRTALSLPSVHSALSRSGLSVANPGNVLNVATRVETRWRGRAVLDVRFNVLNDASERLGYIETVSGTLTLEPIDGGSVDVPFVAPAPQPED
jgi:hypothetical protein